MISFPVFLICLCEVIMLSVILHLHHVNLHTEAIESLTELRTFDEYYQSTELSEEVTNYEYEDEESGSNFSSEPKSAAEIHQICGRYRNNLTLESLGLAHLRNAQDLRGTINSTTGALISWHQDRRLRRCPSQKQREGISLPDSRKKDAIRAYREGRSWMFFQHMRKAGGSFFCHWAQLNVEQELGFRHGQGCWERGCGQACFLPDQERHHMLTAAKLDEMVKNHSVRVIQQEWVYLVQQRMDEMMKAPYHVLFVTMLRHPVERLKSLYVYEHVEGRDLYKSQHNGTYLGFLEWHKKHVWASHNYYTKSFNGGYGLAERKPVGKDQYLRAVRNLMNFFFVGILERLEESSEYMEMALGWRPANLYRQVNPSGSGTYNFNLTEVAEVTKHEKWDIKLFAWANELLTQRLACDFRGDSLLTRARVIRQYENASRTRELENAAGELLGALQMQRTRMDELEAKLIEGDRALYNRNGEDDAQHECVCNCENYDYGDESSVDSSEYQSENGGTKADDRTGGARTETGKFGKSSSWSDHMWIMVATSALMLKVTSYYVYRMAFASDATLKEARASSRIVFFTMSLVVANLSIVGYVLSPFTLLSLAFTR